MPLMETTIGRLYSDDVGKRVVVTQDGVGFDGTLTCLDVTRADYNFKDRPKVTAALTVKVLDVQPSGDKVLAELKLTGLPLDYKIQVEQDWVPLHVEGIADPAALPGTDKENKTDD